MTATTPDPPVPSPLHCCNEISYQWRGAFNNHELNQLHAEAFHHPPQPSRWWQRVNQHSLGWVCARQHHTLVGFVNLAWDGAAHAFLLDTLVAATARGQGIGTNLVRHAAEHARAAGCAWLHVDFEEHLHEFYLNACGFTPTAAGLIAL